MGRSYVVVEGRGENGAVEYLLRMLSVDLGHPGAFWSVVGRTSNLKSPSALAVSFLLTATGGVYP